MQSAYDDLDDDAAMLHAIECVARDVPIPTDIANRFDADTIEAIKTPTS